MKKLDKEGCLTCQTWRFERKLELKEGLPLLLLIDKCYTCAKYKIIDLPDWNKLLKEYGYEENPPKSKEELIREINGLDYPFFEAKKVFCQCNQDNQENNISNNLITNSPDKTTPTDNNHAEEKRDKPQPDNKPKPPKKKIALTKNQINPRTINPKTPKNTTKQIRKKIKTSNNLFLCQLRY